MVVLEQGEGYLENITEFTYEDKDAFNTITLDLLGGVMSEKKTMTAEKSYGYHLRTNHGMEACGPRSVAKENTKIWHQNRGGLERDSEAFVPRHSGANVCIY